MMPNHTPTRALIYCRVSTSRQSTEGHGLESQEARCRQRATQLGLEVEATFPDDVSGGGDFMKRPGLVALLSYLDAQPNRRDYVVIFDDLKRFARDTEFHIKLRRAFKTRGARVECLNFKFEDTPEGKFVETILAAQGELEREQNSRQVVQKMRVRATDGYWLFRPLPGYRFAQVPGHGKLLVRDEPLASIVVEALNGYASGRFQSQTEVKRFLESHPSYPRGRNGEVHLAQVSYLLTRLLYAGYFSIDLWDLHLVKGKHEALITLETHNAIQARLSGSAKVPARKDLSADFPLRNFVVCAHCGEPLTACWSKGRSKPYPYYLCDTRKCPESRKSVRKEKLEGDFERLLAGLRPTATLFNAAFEMIRDLWDAKLGSRNERAAEWQKQLTRLEAKSEQLLDRAVEASTAQLAAAYEKRMQSLEAEKAVLREKLSSWDIPAGAFNRTYRTAFEFLSNPSKLWHSPRIEDRRAVLKLVFAQRLAYDRKSGYRTAETALPFKLLGSINMKKLGMVEPIGIEPTTF